MAEALPQYIVRRSTRARRASIRVLPGRTPGTSVEVVLPQWIEKRHAEDYAAAMVRDRAEWILRTMRRLSVDQAPPCLKPVEVPLRALDEVWPVRYGTGHGGALRLLENAGELHFMGAAPEDSDHALLLQRWLKDRGRTRLTPMVRGLERETGMHCRGVQVRLQKTRWGSCSGRGTLSLNAALLFLPPDMARYVLLHELCHTAHLNHSHEFWKMLTRLEPRTRALDAAMNSAWSFVPAWVAVR